MVLHTFLPVSPFACPIALSSFALSFFISFSLKTHARAKVVGLTFCVLLLLLWRNIITWWTKALSASWWWVQSMLLSAVFFCLALTRKASGFVAPHNFLSFWPGFVIATSAGVPVPMPKVRRVKRGAVQSGACSSQLKISSVPHATYGITGKQTPAWPEGHYTACALLVSPLPEMSHFDNTWPVTEH